MKSFKQFLLEQSQSQQIKCDINGICKIIRKYESAGNEKKILSKYLDSKGLETIGHGHLITPESKQIFSDVFPAEHKVDPDFGKKALDGLISLTPAQVETLFARDVQSKLPGVVKMIPEFESMTSELQGELVSEHFRGMLGKSPKAISLLNQGKYNEAANEYLNSTEYREAKGTKDTKPKNPGLAPRMENLANAIRTEVQRRKERQQSSQSTNQVPPNSSTSQTSPSR